MPFDGTWPGCIDCGREDEDCTRYPTCDHCNEQRVAGVSMRFADDPRSSGRSPRARRFARWARTRRELRGRMGHDPRP